MHLHCWAPILQGISSLAATRLEDDFEVEDCVLGSGMSGSVRLASHRCSCQRFALKTLSKVGCCEARCDEIRSEVEVHISIDHPHIAKLERVYETDRHVHLVLEHLKGGELFDAVSVRAGFDELTGAQIVHQMFSAVAHLHSQRVIHRDLKLENFIFESEGDLTRLKLIDFSFARRYQEHERLSDYCGSSDYVAPEVVALSYTETADVWSLGIAVYMLLCGTSPWDTQSDAETLSMIRVGGVDFAGEHFQALSLGARNFLRSLLTLDPAARPTAAEALRDPWLRLHMQRGIPPPFPYFSGAVSAVHAVPMVAFASRSIGSKDATGMPEVQPEKCSRDGAVGPVERVAISGADAVAKHSDAFFFSHGPNPRSSGRACRATARQMFLQEDRLGWA